MTSLADLPELIGFFSYSRDDDQDSNNALSAIRALIQNELRARLGRSRQSLRLWQDQEAVAPGSMWESQINAAVQQSVFFIPIITPRVINSKYCGIEFKRFLDRERELGRDDLVFPILYIDVDELQDENQWRGHPLLEVIGQRQYVDWREYRYELDSPTLRRAAANLCAKIAASLRRPQPDERTEAADREAAAQREADRVAREHAEKERRRNEDAERARIEEERRDRAKAEMPPLKQEVDPPDAEVILPNAEKSRPERQQGIKHKGANPPLAEQWRAAIEWGKDSDLRTTARAPSNINFRLVVCALLVLQGIVRAGYGIDWYSLHSSGNPDIPFLLIFLPSAAAPVIIAFGITLQIRWTRVLGLIAAGIGVLFDFMLRGYFGGIPLILSIVIGVVVIIYLIRGYRPVSRTA
jgi:hypothetical protein